MRAPGATLAKYLPMPDYLTRRDVLRCAAALFGVRFARGQDAPVFSADVKVVNVLATVRNKTGSLAGNLNQDDFSLSEDGRPQTIRYFARESDLPLTLGLLVDTSGSQRRVLDAERGASLRFLDQVVREKKDQVFIMQFDSAVADAPGTHFLGRANWTMRWPTWTPRPSASCACSMAAALCFTMPWPRRPMRS